MRLEEVAAIVVRALLEVNGEGWPFRVQFGSDGAYISNIVDSNHDLEVIFVPLNSFESSAWDMAIGEAVINRLNTLYQQGKRDFTREEVAGVVRTFRKITPYFPGKREWVYPPEPEPEPATPEEKKGAELVQLLQKMAGIDEPFEKALSGWRGMSDHEKEVTMDMAKLFGAKKAKHRLN